MLHTGATRLWWRLFPFVGAASAARGVSLKKPEPARVARHSPTPPVLQKERRNMSLLFIRYCKGALCLCVVACGVIVSAAPSAAADAAYDQMQALARDTVFGWAKLHPIFATSNGIPGEDGALDTPSVAEDARDLALTRAWEKRLDAISLIGGPGRGRRDAGWLG